MFDSKQTGPRAGREGLCCRGAARWGAFLELYLSHSLVLLSKRPRGRFRASELCFSPADFRNTQRRDCSVQDGLQGGPFWIRISCCQAGSRGWVVGAEQLAGERGGTELVDCLLSQEGLIAAFLLSTGMWILQGGLGGGGMRCAGVCCSRLFVLHPP